MSPRHITVKAAAEGSARLPYTAVQGEVLPRGKHAHFHATRLGAASMRQRTGDLLALMDQRRSLRFFSSDPVPLDVIQQCVRVAGTAPSGAHCQPWTFVIVTDPQRKAAIRAAVEAEEQINYDRRMRKSWVGDVQGLVDNLHAGAKADKVVKPYLTEAPAIVVVMKQVHGVDEAGAKVDHYYVEQSVGLAVGLFLAALTNIGLFTLTSTPMGAEKAIRDVCGRPEHEKVFLLMPVGWAADDATVPYRDDSTLRKPLEEVAVVV